MNRHVPIHISGRICTKIELTSSNSSLKEVLEITGTYEIQNFTTPSQIARQATYYNSRQNTYLLLSREEIGGLEVDGGIWMVW